MFHPCDSVVLHWITEFNVPHVTPIIKSASGFRSMRVLSLLNKDYCLYVLFIGSLILHQLSGSLGLGLTTGVGVH